MNHSPQWFIDYAYLQKKNIRRIKYKIKQKIKPITIDFENLVQIFKKIGLENGDRLFMHSSMSAFGHIEGGPQTVIKALEEVVDGDGLIVMPAFPLVGNAIDYIKRGEVFDIKRTPSRMGAITEAFRKTPNVERSLHPTHSVCAKGRGANEFVNGHENCKTPFDLESPFGKMIEQNVLIIGFGAEIHHFTLQHTFADSCGEKYPFNIYNGEKYSVRCIDFHGKEKTVKTLVNDPVLSERRWDSVKSKGIEIKRRLEEGGFLTVTKFAKGEIITIRAKDFMAELGRLLEDGITVYDLPIEKGTA